MYDSIDYAKSRLEGSIVITDELKPVRVDRILYNEMYGGPEHAMCLFDTVVEVTDLVELSEIKIPYCRLNFRDIKLGFLPRDLYSDIYLSRLPLRNDWRQGIRDGSVITDGGACNLTESGAGLYAIQQSNYPRLFEACEMLETFRGRPLDDGVSMKKAFSRHFAVGFEGKRTETLLHYKSWTIGEMVAGVPLLDEDYMYLAERLEETMNNV